ncbi:MAG: hypothetical protein IJ925_07595 [Muribaculaceae bacterium]|nr:hypothetical protein [Muribaculaceae bacterium]
MNNTKFNFAAVISIIVLLLYSYVVFMGMVYWKDGHIVLGLICSILLIAVVLACVVVMCKARATRWKKLGNIGQFLFGGIILMALIISSMPFAHFFNLLSKQKEINQSFEQAYTYATQINKAYTNYVETRKDKTREFLNNLDVTKGKDNPKLYRDVFAMPGGNHSDKINRMITSLERTLLPDVLIKANEQNATRLKEGSKMSVWNVAMPNYINSMNEGVNKNVNTYTELSKKAHGYKGDNNSEPFKYEEFSNQNLKLKSMLTTMSMPSIISIIAALLCFGFMLLPYYLVEQDLAAGTSRRNKSFPTARPTQAMNYGGRVRRSRINERKQRYNY